jgi:hypothetical protein
MEKAFDFVYADPANFSPPTVYGVYAVSGGKLFTLGPLPIKVADPRVGISAGPIPVEPLIEDRRASSVVESVF